MCAVWQFLSRTDKVPALSSWLESLFFTHKRWYFERYYAPRATALLQRPVGQHDVVHKQGV